MNEQTFKHGKKVYLARPATTCHKCAFVGRKLHDCLALKATPPCHKSKRGDKTSIIWELQDDS